MRFPSSYMSRAVLQRLEMPSRYCWRWRVLPYMWMMSRADIRRPAVVASGSWGREWTLNFFQLYDTVVSS